MKRHMKRKHNLNSNNVTSQKGKCFCNECDRQFYRIKDLREHLSSSHGLIFKTDAIHLQNVKGNNDVKYTFSTRVGIGQHIDLARSYHNDIQCR